jgi:hypothetical protein
MTRSLALAVDAMALAAIAAAPSVVHILIIISSHC